MSEPDYETELQFEDWRQGDQRWFVADTTRARRSLGLHAPRGWREGVAALAEWLSSQRIAPRAPRMPIS